MSFRNTFKLSWISQEEVMALDDSEDDDDDDEDEGTDMESDLESKKEDGKHKKHVYLQDLFYFHSSSFNRNFIVFLRSS